MNRSKVRALSFVKAECAGENLFQTIYVQNENSQL